MLHTVKTEIFFGIPVTVRKWSPPSGRKISGYLAILLSLYIIGNIDVSAVILMKTIIRCCGRIIVC